MLTRTRTRSRGRVALVGALGAAVLSVPFAAPAGADSSFDYSGKTGAISIQAAMDSNPEFSSVADLTDLQVTTTDATFDSYGTSDSSGHVGNLNGLGTLPGLLCLAGLPCSDIGGAIQQPLPPADPLDAHAAYPSPKSADAPVANGQVVQLSGGSPSSAQVAAGVAHAEADLTHALATATGHQTSLVSNVSIGSSTASQLIHLVNGALVTHAEATVNDINIGGTLLHIGSVHAVSDVSTKPGAKAIDHSSLTVGGVTVVGQPATIDQDGVHLSAGELPSNVQSQLQNFLNNQLAAGGLTVSVAGVSATDDDNGHTSLVQGLIVGVKTTVKGAPAPNLGTPQQAQAACTQIFAALPPDLTGNIPVDPCSGVGINPNADYFGQIVLGQAGTISLAASSSFDDVLPTLPTTPIPSGPVTPSSAPPSVPSSTTFDNSGGSTTFTPPESQQLPATGPQPSVAAPAPAGTGASTRTVALDEGLGHGLHGKLLWLFPVMLLAVLGAIAGRLGAPHRLPAPRR